MKCHSQQVLACSKSRIETAGKSYEICSKLTIKTPEGCQWLCSGFFVADIEHISHLFCNLNVDFEQLFAGWNWTINVQLQ